MKQVCLSILLQLNWGRGWTVIQQVRRRNSTIGRKRLLLTGGHNQMGIKPLVPTLLCPATTSVQATRDKGQNRSGTQHSTPIITPRASEIGFTAKHVDIANSIESLTHQHTSLRHLARHKQTSPIEQCAAKIRSRLEIIKAMLFDLILMQRASVIIQPGIFCFARTATARPQAQSQVV